MNALNRILVILGTLVVLALLAVFILVITGAVALEALFPSPAVAAQLRGVMPVEPAARVAAIAVSAALFVLGLALLFRELRPSEPREQRVTLSDDGVGRVTLSVDGLRELASREASSLPGVRAVRSRIVDNGRTLRVAGRVMVDPGASVPDVAREVQARVKEVVEYTLGRPVSEVRIDAEVARPDQERPPRRVR